MTAETLYDHDFVTWTERQAAALRDAGHAGANLPLDWENLAEEIEDLGRSVRNKVRSLAFQIQLHLLKMACSPASDQRRHWMNEVVTFRQQLHLELDDNRALAARFDELSSGQTAGAVKDARRLLCDFGEAEALPRLEQWKLRGISADEVLTRGAYPEPGTLTFSYDED